MLIEGYAPSGLVKVDVEDIIHEHESGKRAVADALVGKRVAEAGDVQLRREAISTQLSHAIR
jgi:hypothetical protein